MTKFRTNVSTLLDGIEKIYDILSDFDPELERIEIDYDEPEAELAFGVEVPDNPVERFGNTIDLERPRNFTFKCMRSKNTLHSYDIHEISDTEYRFPANELNSSEKYRLVISGTPSREALEDIIKEDKYEGRCTRNCYEYNIVYINSSVTSKDNEAVTIVTNILEKFSFDENYIPRKIREKIPESIEEYHSKSWSTHYESDSSITDISTDIDELPSEVQDVLDTEERDRWFCEEVVGDFVQTEGIIKYYDCEFSDEKQPIPNEFIVRSRADLGEGEGLTEGQVIFQKEQFWEETRNELFQKK